jgi:hypothetical protein
MYVRCSPYLMSGIRGRIPLQALDIAVDTRLDELLDVDETLAELANVGRQAAQVLKLPFFAGPTLEEVSVLLAVSPRTIHRDWALARAWFTHQLGRSTD